MLYDKPLDIATGNSRKTKSWKNVAWKWSAIAERLKQTTRTAETVAEYRKMSRDRQSDVKDVGGFVGGYCNNGNRSDVRHRSLVALDADYGDRNIWPEWLTLYGNAAVLYSTHKHTPDAPRLRLIVPLSRNVSPDEYQAIARRIAGTLGIEKFDDSSYQPQRLMYWPSTSQDGEFVYEVLDAPFIDADAVLATYHDWRDASSWPVSSRVTEIVKKSASKQQNPTEKAGIVGAFCRAYTIQEAIEKFVPDYVPTTEPNRYTYTQGSTAGGVVIYDDLFSYSHHATDPASEQLCNAFDLVRLHRFGELDKDTAPDTAPTKRPSYEAMTQFAADDDGVKAQLITDMTAGAKEDFSAPAEEAPNDWPRLLRYTDKGALAQCIENAVVLLEHDDQIGGALALNDMEHSIVVTKDLPWRVVKGDSQWTDADDAGLRYYLEKRYKLTGKDKIFDAVNVAAQKRAFHPVRDYLNGCTWDGVPRVDTLLIDYLGADDNEYIRAVSRKTLVAAVARIMRPGCKFDYMLVLRGRQGIGKSTLIARLGRQWFSDSFATLQGKEAFEQVLGVWLMEVGELACMRKAEAETIKLFISKQVDRFRPAYGRRLQEFPRQCIFIGTTNEAQFLRDATGNRRFWVVDTPNKPILSPFDLTAETVSNIWAEAVELYNKGEPLYLPREIEEQARAVQEAYEEENPRAGIVVDYIDRLLPENWSDMDTYARRQWLEMGTDGNVKRKTVCVLEIWSEALGQPPERLDRYGVKEICDIMEKLPEWRRVSNLTITIKPYGRQKYFERKEKK